MRAFSASTLTQFFGPPSPLTPSRVASDLRIFMVSVDDALKLYQTDWIERL